MEPLLSLKHVSKTFPVGKTILGKPDKFVHAVPDSVNGGILLAAPVTVMAGQLGEGGNMHKYPLAIVAGVGLLILISFSDKYQEKRKNN